jgi:hypothetical protein
MSGRSADEIGAGYEALRAAASGQHACDTPRGLSLLQTQGLPAWMRAWSPLPPPRPVVPSEQPPVTAGVGTDVVRVLTEMVLGTCTRLAAS